MIKCVLKPGLPNQYLPPRTWQTAMKALRVSTKAPPACLLSHPGPSPLGLLGLAECCSALLFIWLLVSRQCRAYSASEHWVVLCAPKYLPRRAALSETHQQRTSVASSFMQLELQGAGFLCSVNFFCLVYPLSLCHACLQRIIIVSSFQCCGTKRRKEPRTK